MSLTKASYSMITGAVTNVLDFGAVGNGSTNDAPAIQNALTAAATTTGAVFVPYGIYRIASQISIPKGVKLFGEGPGAWPKFSGTANSYITTYHTATFAIDFGAGGTSKANAAILTTSQTAIDGLAFYYPNQIGSGLSPILYPPTIALVGDPNEDNKCFVCNITNCVLANPWIGIDATVFHEQLLIQNLKFFAWNTGIVIDNGTDTDIIQNVLANATMTYVSGDFPASNDIFAYAFLNNGVGIKIGRSDGIRLENISIIGMSRGLLLTSIAGAAASGVGIYMCNFEGSIYPLQATAGVQGVTIANSNFDTYRYTLSGVTGANAIQAVGTSGSLIRSWRIVSSEIRGVNSSLSITYGIYISVKDCTLIGSQTAGNIYNFYLQNVSNINIHDSNFAVSPFNSAARQALLLNSEIIVMTDNTIDGQQNSLNSIYVDTCNNIRIKNSNATNTTSPKTVGFTSTTASFGEPAYQLQGNATVTLNGFPSPSSTSCFYSQTDSTVYINIRIEYGGTTTITNPAMYITNLPVPMAHDSVFATGDGGTFNSYGVSVGDAGGQRIYAAPASNVSTYVISGTYTAGL
jgi:hypothetical protein